MTRSKRARRSYRGFERSSSQSGTGRQDNGPRWESLHRGFGDNRGRDAIIGATDRQHDTIIVKGRIASNLLTPDARRRPDHRFRSAFHFMTFPKCIVLPASSSSSPLSSLLPSLAVRPFLKLGRTILSASFFLMTPPLPIICFCSSICVKTDLNWVRRLRRC